MSSQTSTQRYAPVQVFSAVFGLVYLAVGVWGWVLTGFSGEGEIIVFHVNALHNAIHTVIGLTAIAGAATPRTAGLALTVLGVVLSLVTVLGFFGLLGMLAMDHGIADPDNFLHLVTGALALIVGLQFGPDDSEVE